MLPKTRRLRAAEVREVLKKGRGSRAGNLSVKYLADQGSLRTAAVVSKAVAKRAVDRNRLRRALYRALAPLSGKGRAVFFVQKVPPAPLSASFAEDIALLESKLR